MSENDASRIVIDNYRVALQTVASLTCGARGVIGDCNMFIVQATGVYRQLDMNPRSQDQ